MDWLTRLAGKLPGGIAGWPTLEAHLAAMPRREAVAIVRAMLDAWLRGELELGEWERLTGVVGEAPLRHVHVLWDRLVEADLARKEIVHPAALTRAVATRWAWTPRWRLYDQDEELLLFGDEHVLLEAIAPDCPKHGYVLDVVAHAARDAAHGSVVLGSGRDGLALAAELLPVAQAAHAPELAAYLARLASYRLPARVKHSDATARGRDLCCCHPPAPGEMTVSPMGDGWEIRYRAAGFRLSRATGRMAPISAMRAR